MSRRPVRSGWPIWLAAEILGNHVRGPQAGHVLAQQRMVVDGVAQLHRVLDLAGDQFDSLPARPGGGRGPARPGSGSSARSRCGPCRPHGTTRRPSARSPGRRRGSSNPGAATVSVLWVDWVAYTRTRALAGSGRSRRSSSSSSVRRALGDRGPIAARRLRHRPRPATGLGACGRPPCAVRERSTGVEAGEGEPGLVPQEHQIGFDRQAFLHHPLDVIDDAVEGAVGQRDHLDAVELAGAGAVSAASI